MDRLIKHSKFSVAVKSGSDSYIKLPIPPDAFERNARYSLVPSRIGAGIILLDEIGHLFYKHRDFKDGCRSSWLCKKRRRFKCPASIRVHGNEIYWQRNFHNHDVDVDDTKLYTQSNVV